MIYLELFLTFLKIGAFTFGGGYAMIALIREEVLLHGWLTEEALLNIIAVAESTPGPIAVNMATFVGSTQGGILGSLLATLGVVLPSFIIILLIAALASTVLNTPVVRAALGGIRPAIVGMILATALTMALSLLFGITSVQTAPAVNLGAVLLALLLAGLTFLSRAIFKKPLPPILLIVLSGALGVLFFGVLPF